MRSIKFVADVIYPDCKSHYAYRGAIIKYVNREYPKFKTLKFVMTDYINDWLVEIPVENLVLIISSSWKHAEFT